MGLFILKPTGGFLEMQGFQLQNHESFRNTMVSWFVQDHVILALQPQIFRVDSGLQNSQSLD